MLLGEPRRTQFDLNFKLFGFPVRIHPFFWLISVIIGLQGGREGFDGVEVVLWVLAMLVSILVHELGHALAMRYYGSGARVVLYSLGGLAIPESAPYQFNYQQRNTTQAIVISAAGPAAGFALALLIVGLVFVTGGKVELISSFPRFWSATLPAGASVNLAHFVDSLLWVNILWGLVNLLPVYPLDGGQISREIFIMVEPQSGVVRSLWLSMIAAASMILVAIYLKSIFIGLMFGMLAFSSYMMIQQYRGGGFGGFGGFGGGGRGGGGFGGGSYGDGYDEPGGYRGDRGW